MERLNSLWVEKYRPQNLDTYVGNDFIKDKVKVYLETSDVPHLLLHGQAGTGKTTLAKIITNNVDCDMMYINASVCIIIQLPITHTYMYWLRPEDGISTLCNVQSQ